MPTVRSTISCPDLIGRDAELGRLEDALSRTMDGLAGTVLVTGEAGIGKSRLLREFMRVARDRGVRVWRGHCVPIGDTVVPYAPVVEILREAAAQGCEQVLRAAGAGEGWLAPFLPEIEVTRRTAEPFETPASQLAALSALLDRMADEPTVIVVEDLHWADPGTWKLLNLMLRAGRRGQLLIVCSFRDDELRAGHPVRAMVAELQRCDIERIALRRFDRSATAALISGILGWPAAPELVNRLHARSGGNPFFAEELLAAGSGRALPAALRELVLLRFHDLPEAAQQAVRIVAVTGHGADHDLLESVADDAEESLDGLETAVDRHVLVHHRTSYRFRHALVAEAVRTDMLPAQRVRLHRATARALTARLPDGPATASSYASRLATIAYHWLAGRDLNRALVSTVDAALAAERVLAFPQAQAHFRRALHLWWDAPGARRCTALDYVGIAQHAAEMAYLLDDVDTALTLINRALEHSPALADAHRTGLLHERRGRYLLGSGHPRSATLPEFQTAVSLVPEEPTEARAQVLAGLAGMHLLDTRFTDAEDWAVRTIETARLARAPRQEAHGLGTLGVAQVMLGTPEQAVGHLRLALDITTRLGHPDDLWRAFVNLSDALHNTGDFREAVDVAMAGLDKLDQHGTSDVHTGYLHAQRQCLLGNAARSMFWLGRWDDMTAQMRKHGTGTANNKIHLNIWLAAAALHTARGQFASARQSLDVAQALADGAYTELTGLLYAERADLAVWQHDADSAQEYVNRATDVLRHGSHGPLIARVTAIAARVLADLPQRRPGRAAQIVALRHRIAMLVERPLTPLARAHLETASAELAREGDASAAERWARAGDVWTHLQSPYSAAYARWRQAEALLAQGGKRRPAACAVASARDIASDLGAAPLLREIDALVRRARLVLTDVPPSAARRQAAAHGTARFGLTPREEDVLLLLGDGSTNRQIARTLCISEKTVHIHVSRILAKMDVSNRSAAAAAAHRLGLLSPQRAGGRRSTGAVTSERGASR